METKEHKYIKKSHKPNEINTHAKNKNKYHREKNMEKNMYISSTLKRGIHKKTKIPKETNKNILVLSYLDIWTN